MSKRASRILFAGIATAAVLAGGCGDEDGGGSVLASGGEEERLTTAQYAKEATALCIRSRRQISEELNAFIAMGQGDGSSGEVEREAVEEVVLSGFRSQYEGLRKLPPPRGDEDFLDLMLSKFSLSLEDGEENLARFFRVKPSGYSEFAEGTLMTKEYGVRGCGSLGRSPRVVVDAF